MILALSTVSQALEPVDFAFGPDTSGYKLEWDGVTGVSSFIQYSTDLVDWSYFPVIKSGVGSYSFGFSTSEDKLFVRLVSTDVPMDDPELDDLDGDGIGNLAELTSTVQTSPLSWDTDGDGMNDGWEVLMNFDPTVVGTGSEDPAGDQDSDSYTNLMESLLGLNPAVGIELTSESTAGLEIYTPN